MTVLRKRHIAKAFSWRFVASITTFLIGWIISGNIATGLSIGLADVIIKLILYYWHERIWYKSNFGVVIDDHRDNIKKD